jgi:hypothetical protein
MHFEESCFTTLSIVKCFYLKTTFRQLALLPSSGKKGGAGVARTLWGPLERASLPTFYLKTEAEKVSETLFLKKNIGRWIKS